MASRFSGVQLAAPIEVFAVSKKFSDDTHEKKVNLSVGAYRTDEGTPWVLPVVRETETAMAADETLNHEYLGIKGLDSFSTAASKMVLGEDCVALKEGKVFGAQTISGTGALRVCADTLHNVLKLDTFYFSKPTWGNHKSIFEGAGFKETRQYRYWDAASRSLDFSAMLEDLRNAPENAVIILHACAHNPTGVDPTQEQWKEIAEVVVSRKLYPVFDTAYQGFASGDLDKDAWSVRYFASLGIEMMVTQSFAKNFGLYNERVGNLTVVMSDASVIPAVKSQIDLLIRANYSSPPNHGARIVSRVLNDEKLFNDWRECIRVMSSRIQSMRVGLRERLEKLGTPGKWDHITSQIGMFSFTGLNATQVTFLAEKYHLYLVSSGRINICGLTTKNIDYVAEAINDAVVNVK